MMRTKMVVFAGLVAVGTAAPANCIAAVGGLAGEKVGPWDLSRLCAVPATLPTTEYAREGFRSFFYESVAFRGRPTRVYAYYKTPDGEPPPGGWPAVVCLHGGGGTAFPQWIDEWTRRGYAALAMDLEGHLPDQKLPHDKRPTFEGSGPQRTGAWDDFTEPVEDRWFYHAVAHAVLAHSLVRSFPEVNDEPGTDTPNRLRSTRWSDPVMRQRGGSRHVVASPCRATVPPGNGRLML